MLLFSACPSHAQSRGARPIEFSEPRDKRGQATNDQQFGAERRRLTDLEDRLSKTFNFFDFEDSMSGAPAPRMPRRVPVVPKQAKPSGLLTDGEDWAVSPGMSTLDDMENEENRADHPFDPDTRDDYRPKEADLLNSLKSEDWLVNATMSEGFWEMPLVARQDPTERPPWESSLQQDISSFDSRKTEDLRPRLEGLLGRNEHMESPFGNRDGGNRSFSGENAYELGRASQARVDTRRDEYRALLGMEVKPETSQSLAITTPGSSGRRYDSFEASSQVFANPDSRSQRSLYPVRSADRSSLYPTAPTAPQRPSLLDPIEVERASNSAPPPASAVSNPFYEPPRRQF